MSTGSLTLEQLRQLPLGQEGSTPESDASSGSDANQDHGNGSGNDEDDVLPSGPSTHVSRPLHKRPAEEDIGQFVEHVSLQKRLKPDDKKALRDYSKVIQVTSPMPILLSPLIF